MARINSRLDNAVETFVNNWKAKKSAMFSLKSEKCEVSVILELNIGHHSEQQEATRGHQNLQRRQVGPSQLHRREKRSADVAHKVSPQSTVQFYFTVCTACSASFC